MLHRQRHSSCAVLPRVTPPPGLVADAKFRTQTRFPDFAYAEIATKRNGESENHKPYTWDDLDGKRPTMEEFEKENE